MSIQPTPQLRSRGRNGLIHSTTAIRLNLIFKCGAGSFMKKKPSEVDNKEVSFTEQGVILRVGLQKKYRRHLI